MVGMYRISANIFGQGLILIASMSIMVVILSSLLLVFVKINLICNHSFSPYNWELVVVSLLDLDVNLFIYILCYVELPWFSSFHAKNLVLRVRDHHGHLIGHNETYCGSCYGAEVVYSIPIPFGWYYVVCWCWSMSLVFQSCGIK